MRVLLHTCCGPCTAYPLLRLREEGHEVEGFFFNPNIHPWREHQRRARTMAQYAGMVGLPLTADESWDVRAFLEAALAAPSPAERCRACYRLRLTSTAREARARGFDAFTTTLLVSPFQRHGLVAAAGAQRGDPNRIIRPPRVMEEALFTDQCVRCGMCVQACPTQTLQPLWLEAGLAGLWTPAVTPRIGGCIPDCNACSLVCPTEAIPAFTKRTPDKWVVKMGTAVFESGRCISYTDNLNCARCILVCPTKAIPQDTSPGPHPVRPAGVDFMRCMGCGLCETECLKIVFGESAILTFSKGRGQPTVLR